MIFLITLDIHSKSPHKWHSSILAMLMPGAVVMETHPVLSHSMCSPGFGIDSFVIGAMACGTLVVFFPHSVSTALCVTVLGLFTV